jgi:hypothetical protein
MKNLAGHDVSIFLFRFVPRKNAISFVLNEGIAEDLYPQTEAQLQPLVHACCETLLRYKELCHSGAIMDGNILRDGGFEVMLSPGLGKHFAEREKQNLFNDAHKISELLLDVMKRRSKELKEGTYLGPQSVTPQIGRTGIVNEGFEALGKERQQAESFARQASPRPELKQLAPEDLPDGVVATASYDHRGHCLAFSHNTLGHLGKIVLSPKGSETLMETELSKENPQHLGKKKAILEEISAVIEAGLINIPTS